MSKKSKRHSVYYLVQDEHGCTPHVVEWEGERERYSDQDIARAVYKRHNQKYKFRQGKESVRTNEHKVWRTIKNIAWWVWAYTLAVIKFSLTLSWKIIVFIFVVFIGQILLGLLLSR